MTGSNPAAFVLWGLAAALMVSSAFASARTLIEGRSGSLVRVLIDEDPQCPDSAAFRVMMGRQIRPKYGDRVEFIRRDFPPARRPRLRRAERSIAPAGALAALNNPKHVSSPPLPNGRGSECVSEPRPSRSGRHASFPTSHKGLDDALAQAK